MTRAFGRPLPQAIDGFTDIPAAVMSVPSGATLLIRSGAYTGFTIDAKGLTLLADAGVSVAGTTIVQNTSPSQAVRMHGIDLTAATLGTGVVLRALDCLGPVVFADLTTPPNPPAELGPASYWFTPRGLVVQNCTQLVVRNSSIWGASLVDSRSVVESCIMRGMDMQLTAGFPSPASEGLTIAGGHGEVIGDSQLIAGASLYNAQPAGLRAILSIVNIRSGTISSLSGAGLGWAIQSVSSTVRIDPSVSVIAAISPPSIGAVATVAMPEVVSTNAPLGGSMQGSVATVPGDLVVLLVGALGPAIMVNGFADPFWFDPAAVVV